MKRILLLLSLAALSAFSQETTKHKIVRRILAASACITSAYDGYQTARVIGQQGTYELNPIGFNSKLLALKGAACVAPIVVGEWGSRHHNALLTNFALGASALQTGVFSVVLVHNQGVIGAVERANALDQKQPQR
jgi:hypothetical protein